MAREGEKPKELGVDKVVATLLLSIDQEIAAGVMRHLADDSVDTITRAMQELQEIAVDRETIRTVYERTAQRMRQGGMALGDVGGAMRTVLARAFGEERSKEVARRAHGDILARRPFAMFESLTTEDLASLLAEEHPQIVAVFVAHLDRQKAGELLKQLPDEQRADLVYRIASLDRTPAEVVQRVLEVMRKKVKDLGLAALRNEPKSWIRVAAGLLNNLGGGEKTLLEKIEAQDGQLAAAIRDEMFTFDDIQKLDKKAMQKILAAVDSRQLAISLKAAVPAVEQAILGNLSKRASDMVREERDNLGPMPLTEVTAAQNEILKMIRDLVDKGEIKVGGAAEAMV
jgi:flagellar motor switch protein FliG